MTTRHPAPRARRKLLAAASLLACACLIAYALAPRPTRAQDDYEPQQGAQPAQSGRSGEGEPNVTVYGRAVFEGTNRPVRRALVFLVPPGAAGRPAFARMPQCTTGEDGTCETPAAPGEYALVALPTPRGREPADFEADLTRRAAATGARLTLRADETKTFELTLAGGG